MKERASSLMLLVRLGKDKMNQMNRRSRDQMIKIKEVMSRKAQKAVRSNQDLDHKKMPYKRARTPHHNQA